MMAAWVWQGCHTLLWFMKKETMACGHSLLYVFKVRGVSTELVGALLALASGKSRAETSAPPECINRAG